MMGMEQAVMLLGAAMPSAASPVIFVGKTCFDEALVASIVAYSVCLGETILPWPHRPDPMPLLR